MRTNVLANSAESAKGIVRDKVVFYRVEEADGERKAESVKQKAKSEPGLDFLKGIFNIK